MKKLRNLTIIIAVFFTAACSSNDELTIDDLLADLDYMVYVLENNFALLEVANWAHGIDYRELAAAARNTVLNMEYPCRDAFSAIMVYHFAALTDTGHFHIYSLTSFNSTMAGVDDFESLEELRIHNGASCPQEKWKMNVELMMSSATDLFYGGDDISRRIVVHNMEIARLREAYGGVHHRIYSRERMGPAGGAWNYGTYAVRDDIFYIHAGHHLHNLPRLFSGNDPSMNQILRSFNARSSISIEGHIEELFIEHMIIDLRGNEGGDVKHFVDEILRPILRRPIDPDAFIFFKDGPYVRRFGDLIFEPATFTSFMAMTEHYRPIDEILAEFDLPDMPQVDRERLHFGAPAGNALPLEPEPFAPRFHGKIWLLVDDHVLSSAQVAAWLASETGHITLVGDVTGGNMGGPRTIAFMPNTGIMFQFDIFYITDSQGRPFEAGTVPHHFNRPGMDALETVLALIEEGEY